MYSESLYRFIPHIQSLHIPYIGLIGPHTAACSLGFFDGVHLETAMKTSDSNMSQHGSLLQIRLRIYDYITAPLRG